MMGWLWCCLILAGTESVPLFEPGLVEHDSFPRATEVQGVDAEALRKLVQKAGETQSSAVLVIRDGQLLCERTFGEPRLAIETMSATKSVVSLAFGALIEEGALESLDVPVSSLFEDWAEDGRQQITIRHLLNHTSGLAAKPTTENIYASPDIVQFALEAPLKDPPGTTFFYNNRATNLLPAIVESVSGLPIDEYLGETLFAPLGMEAGRFGWMKDSAGNPHGMAGLQLQAIDLARIGQLVLDDGVWRGERLVAQSFLREMLVPTQIRGERLRCGLLWWLRHDSEDPERLRAYSAEGYLGQYLVIVPEHRLVAVRQRKHPGAANLNPAFNFQEFEDLVLELVPSS